MEAQQKVEACVPFSLYVRTWHTSVTETTPRAQTCTLVTHLRIWEKNVRRRTKPGKCYARNHRTSFSSHLLCVGLADNWEEPGSGRTSTPQSQGEATVLRASEQHMPRAAESSRSSECHGQILWQNHDCHPISTLPSTNIPGSPRSQISIGHSWRKKTHLLSMCVPLVGHTFASINSSLMTFW